MNKIKTHNFGPVRQLGYLVSDLEDSVATWQNTLGVGPWTLIKNVPLKCEYMGQPSEPLIDIALAYQGDMQIELIQQTNEAPSPYLSFFQEKRFGLHHTAYLCDDINGSVAAATQQGHEIVCDIKMPDGARYVYTQVPGLGKDIFIEFLQATPIMKQMFSDGIAAAKTYDGSQANALIDFAQF